MAPAWTPAGLRAPGPQPRPVPLLLALACALSLAVAGWGWLLVGPDVSVTAAVVLVAAVCLPAAAVWLAARAGQGGGWPLALIAGAMVLLSDATLRQRGAGGLDLQGVLKFALWALGLLLLFWRAADLRRALGHGPSGALLLFGLWSLLSATWSATPLYTAGAAVAFLGIWVVAVSLAGALPLHRGLQAITAALLLAMALSLLMLAVAPALALTPMDNGRVLRLSGIFGSPNNLGRAAALCLLLAALLRPLLGRREGTVWLLAALGLGGACLLLSDSRGSLIALGAGLAVLVLARRLSLARVLPWLALLWVLLAAVTALLLAGPSTLGDALVALVSRSGRLSELTTLTGRTEIWAAVMELSAQAPLLGHGFASSREVLPAGFRGAFGWTTTSAHNLWLQAGLTTGLIGLGLVLLAQGAWLKQVWRRPLPARDAVMVLLLVVGLIEAGALGPSVNLLTFVWAWAATLGVRHGDD